jgi:hypothetical protein
MSAQRRHSCYLPTSPQTTRLQFYVFHQNPLSSRSHSAASKISPAEKQGGIGREFTLKEAILDSKDCFYTVAKKDPGGLEVPFPLVVIGSLT